MSGYPYGYSGYGHPSSSIRYGYSTSSSPYQSGRVSPLGQSRLEGSSRYHTSRRTYDVTPQPDYSRRESELAQLSRTQSLSGLTSRSTSRRPSDYYGSSGIDISSYGGAGFDPYSPSSRSYEPYRSSESSRFSSYRSSESSRFSSYRSSESSRFSSTAYRDVNYQQASSTYRASPSSSSYGRGYTSSSSRPSDVYVPDSLRIGRSEARNDDRYFSASGSSGPWPGPCGSYSTYDITPSSTSGLHRSDAQRRRRR